MKDMINEILALDINNATKIVFLYLANNKDTQISIVELSKATHIARSCVSSATKELEELGYIEIETVANSNIPNRYILLEDSFNN